jgi:GTP-binding protein
MPIFAPMAFRPVTLRATVGLLTQLDAVPPSLVGEIALVGRSNVGKSSLINTLGNTKIARTSGTPGKTRLIHFYTFGNSFDLVDLPGYGYANVSVKERKVWDLLVAGFVEHRVALKGFLMIMDSRHPFSESDLDALSWLETLQLPYEIVLTKVDKLRQAERASARKALAAVCPTFICLSGSTFFSSTTGEGRQDLIRRIAALISGPEISNSEINNPDVTPA